MIGVMEVMATSFKRTYATMLQLPRLLYSVLLTPWQATVDERISTTSDIQMIPL